jgi:hypothetical protein
MENMYDTIEPAVPSQAQLVAIATPVPRHTAVSVTAKMQLYRIDKRKCVMVQCDVTKIDEEWYNDRIPPFTLDPTQWVKYLASKDNILNDRFVDDPPHITFQNMDKESDKRVYFEGGRNRFANLRDAGVSRLPCIIFRSDLKKLQKLGVVVDPPFSPDKHSKRGNRGNAKENAALNGVSASAVLDVATGRSGACDDIPCAGVEPLTKKPRA